MYIQYVGGMEMIVVLKMRLEVGIQVPVRSTWRAVLLLFWYICTEYMDGVEYSEQWSIVNSGVLRTVHSGVRRQLFRDWRIKRRPGHVQGTYRACAGHETKRSGEG